MRKTNADRISGSPLMRACRTLAWVLCGCLLPLAAQAAGVRVQTLDGQRGSLAEFLSHDKWTVVMVWTTYCEVCRQQYPTISAFHRQHRDKDAVVLGIALDGYDQDAKIKAYQATHAHSFPSVMASVDDFTDKYARATGEAFTGTPTYLLFNAKGDLRAFLDGPVTAAALEKFIAK